MCPEWVERWSGQSWLQRRERRTRRRILWPTLWSEWSRSARSAWTSGKIKLSETNCNVYCICIKYKGWINTSWMMLFYFYHTGKSDSVLFFFLAPSGPSRWLHRWPTRSSGANWCTRKRLRWAAWATRATWAPRTLYIWISQRHTESVPIVNTRE